MTAVVRRARPVLIAAVLATLLVIVGSEQAGADRSTGDRAIATRSSEHGHVDRAPDAAAHSVLPPMTTLTRGRPLSRGGVRWLTALVGLVIAALAASRRSRLAALVAARIMPSARRVRRRGPPALRFT